MSTIAPPVSRLQNPWPGLFWYTEEQADLFFGREEETEELLRLIQRDTLTILFGRSGLGKTSLLRAGVFPRLRRAGFFPVVLRLDYAQQTADPVEQVKALTEAAAHECGLDIESARPAAEARTLWEYFHQTQFWGPRNDRLTPVLVFDQFEEIFTIGNGRQQEILEQLADLAENRVPAAVRQKAEQSAARPGVETGVPNYKIVISLREDFVWRLDTLRPILPAIMRNRFALGPLDAARGLEIVRRAGEQWVDDQVAQDIIDAVISSRQGERPEGAPEEVEPAYLNVMCNELFERMVATGETGITRQLVAAEKGGILESLYERSLAGLDPSVRRFIEEHLVTPSGFRVTIPVEDARREHVSDADLDKLVDRRLLRYEDRLGARHVELAHDLLTGLVAKSREEHEHAVLRKQLRRERMRTAILAVVALLAIVGPVFYWLAYVRPTVSYYANFVRRSGSYQPIGLLSAVEVSHRAQSFRVTRKGFRGEILSIDAINGQGHLILDSDLDSSLFFPTSGNNGQFCRVQFGYDDKGKVVNEVALDEQGHKVFALIYSPEQAETLRNVRRASVIEGDGEKLLSSFDIQYDSQGFIREIQYDPVVGGGTRMTFNAVIIDQIPAGSGFTEEQDFLDKNGAPVAQNGAFTGKHYKVDARGDLTETEFHDAHGNPVLSPDGEPPIWRWKLDQWGNRTEQAFFGVDGNPAVWNPWGYHKAVYTLNDYGEIQEVKFYGVNGETVAENETGCFAYRYDLDANGDISTETCLDRQDAPLNHPIVNTVGQYSKIEYQYDSYGRQIGYRYFDKDNKPTAYNGCYRRLTAYDANGSLMPWVCIDADGRITNPAALNDLAHAVHEVTFDFARAYELDKELLEQVPLPGIQLNLEEAALTADRFDDCLNEAAAVGDTALNQSELVARDAIRLACQFAAGNKADARTTAAMLIGRVALMQPGNWVFDGTRHYLQNSPHFRAGNDAWDKLFESLGRGNGKNAADALRQLQPVLSN